MPTGGVEDVVGRGRTEEEVIGRGEGRRITGGDGVGRMWEGIRVGGGS
jgi:hypothetical protein